MVAIGNRNINSKEALVIQNHLQKMNISVDEALKIGRFKNYKSAIKDKESIKALNKAGLNTSNRDTINRDDDINRDNSRNKLCCLLIPIKFLIKSYPHFPENLWGGIIGLLMGTHIVRDNYNPDNYLVNFLSFNTYTLNSPTKPNSSSLYNFSISYICLHFVCNLSPA